MHWEMLPHLLHGRHNGQNAVFTLRVCRICFLAKPWHPLVNHHEHHQHISYHWHRQTSVEKPSLDKKIFRKTTAPFLIFHFCPESLKKSFSTNFSTISKKPASATPFQSAYRAGDSTETVLLRVVNDILLDLSLVFDTVDHQILFSRCTVFLAFGLLHSSGFSHNSQTDISLLQSITRPFFSILI